MRAGMPTRIGATLILMNGLVAGTMERSQAESPGQSGYVGSESCSACHEDQVAAWRGSHHGWALRAATAASILGDFDDAIFEHGGVRTRFFRRNGQAFVETDGPDGAPTAYEIKYTVGVEPLQQYLVETDAGQRRSRVTASTGPDRTRPGKRDAPSAIRQTS